MDETLKAIEHAAKLAAEKGLIRFTRFLDPAQAIMAGQIAHACGAKVMLYGGYAHAERVIACFYPPDDSVQVADFPFVCLHSRYSSRFCSVSHRDLLGAFMALGLTRSCIGDIIIIGEDIYLFADDKTAAYIVASMTEAGKVPLDFRILSQIPPMPQSQGVSFACVVSSLRLDAVLAGAYRLSRSEAQEIIRGGLVKVDHLPCEHVDALLKENTLLSVRGKGRIRLVSVDGMTRKQRMGITLFRYV